MKKQLYVTLYLVITFSLYAQEVVTPIKPLFLKKPENTTLKKNIQNFPVVDFFTQNGAPNQQFWADANTLVQNRQVIFNALNASNGVYNNADGQADILTLKPANIPYTETEIFITFRISSGSTFSANDSFLVQATNASGNFQSVFSTAGSQPQNREVVLSFSPKQILLSGFQVRFVCYTQLLSNNTQTFLLSNFVLSQKLNVPFFDVHPIITEDSSVNTLFYYGPDAKVARGNTVNFIWGNIISLNMQNAANQPYGFTGYGGGDTLYTNPINVSAFPQNDSLLFSFAAGFGLNKTPTDSLILEFRNNLGIWVRMLQVPGNAFSGIREFSFNINFARFRYADFSARFIFTGNYNDTARHKAFVSAISINSFLQLPFVDDFSTSRFIPNTSNWIDKNVLINNEFPTAQPSLNVATFDGLDMNGNAYTRFPIKGIADVLTSKPFNLSRFEPKDSLIFTLFFQYEPQGTTNQVFPDDSLYIEFSTTSLANDSFVIVKMLSANDYELFNFHRIDIPLTQKIFFNKKFQFRIKNRGSLSGNLSHWHIDYIRFNSGRTVNDFFNDVALTNTPRMYLGKYSSMPWKQYNANKNAYKNDTVSLRIRNMHNQNYAVDYFRNVIKPEGDTLDKFNNIQPTIFANSDTIVRFNRPIVFTTSLNEDSLVFGINYRIRVSGSANDEITTNDTTTVYTVFDNYLAYDDGSAEGGYGIKNKLNAGACLKYNVEIPDTLYGLYIFFNQSETDISTQRYNIKVWKRISELGMPATNDQLMYNREYRGPIFTNFINGFATLAIEPPLAVSDSFYVGWDQANAFVLNIGLDKNYPFGLNQNHFFRMDGRWYRTEIPGALMIRPILGKFKTWPTRIGETLKPEKEQKITVFPNPASDFLVIEMMDEKWFEYNIYDLSGRTVDKGITTNGYLDTSFLNDGLYILHLQNSKINQTHKIIIKR
ncbi:MAG: T9SS type A sorting domain-containing protein [Bacteroidia bacterium]